MQLCDRKRLRGIFVTGTDTGVGKTSVTAALTVLWRAAGVDAVPAKPVQTGCPRATDGSLSVPDLDFALAAAGLALSEAMCAELAPCRFAPACSPHLAARQAGQLIDLAAIRRHLEVANREHAALVVEGAGGVYVPLGRGRFMLDLMQELALPVVVVARPGLGTLNHTILSVKALRQAGLEVAGLLFCVTAPEWGEIEADNLRTLAAEGDVPVLGCIPYLPALAEKRTDAATRLAQAVLADRTLRAATDALLAACAPPATSALVPAEVQAAWERDRSSIWHPYTRHSALAEKPFPLIVRGQGPYLFDASGTRYFDAISSWWACSLGHSHPRLVAALQQQAGLLQHSILGNLSHAPALELADRLLALFPDRHRRVLFASDGACAVEAALRVAVQYWHSRGEPGRCRFAALREAYHGDTLGAMSLGYVPAFHSAYSAIVMPVHHVEAPCCHPCRLGLRPDACQCECLEELRVLLQDRGAELAAVVVEPLCLGAGGMRIYAAACLREIATLCAAAGTLLIVDEIAMGFGRTGRMFAFDHAGIDPDIVCLGKALTGGYLPVSAAVVREGLYAAFSDRPEDHTFYHGHTFAGNPLGTAVAAACLRVYADEDIVGAANRKGGLLRECWRRGAALPGVANVRTLGMIAALDLLDGTNDPAGGARRAQAVRRLLQERGVLLRPLGNVLYLMPPLITSDAQLAEVVDAVFAAIHETASAGAGASGDTSGARAVLT